MKPIYEPKGKAKEYGDYAINIYTGCPHRCYYCFAPSVLRRDREIFHGDVQPRAGIVEAVKRQLEKEQISGKTIHLCFTCDPYPTGYDTMPTREIIRAIKASGNHVQILTKGDGSRDFDLLDSEDWYGATIAGDDMVSSEAEPEAVSVGRRLANLAGAKLQGIHTWVSFEPVLNGRDVLCYIEGCREIIDRVKIGKLNYHPSDIDWAKFGHEAEALCQRLGLDYYIKDSLRAEMEAERDGRLVVLPCKVGDSVYFAENGEIKKAEVESIHQKGALFGAGGRCKRMPGVRGGHGDGKGGKRR